MAHMDISVELLAKKKLMTSSVERQHFFLPVLGAFIIFLIFWSHFISECYAVVSLTLDLYLYPPTIVVLLIFHIYFVSLCCCLWSSIKFLCRCLPLILPITYHPLPFLRLFFLQGREMCLGDDMCSEDDELLLERGYKSNRMCFFPSSSLQTSWGY